MIDSSAFQGKTAAYFTLGCKLNFSETSTIMRQLIEAGAHKAARGEKADICIINTCSVTEVADKKCRQAIHKIVRENPDAYIVVTGWYPGRWPIYPVLILCLDRIRRAACWRT